MAGGAGALIAVGADGYPKGWVAIVLADGRFADAAVFAGFADLVRAYADADAIAVDMPIGLPAVGWREADLAARTFLAPHASRVFRTHPRLVLEEDTYAAALARCAAGARISRQSYALRKRIFEVEHALRLNVHEIHPEVTFRELAGRPVPSKHTWAGAAERTELLSAAGVEVPTRHGAETAPAADVLDAAAAAWSAQRIAVGAALTLPDAPPRDADTGRPVAIWY